MFYKTVFPAYQQIFRQQLREGPSFYSTQVKTFLESTASTINSNDSSLQQVVHQEWGNVMTTLEKYDRIRFKRIVELLVTANRVFILGLRGVFPLAFYLAHYLRFIRVNYGDVLK